MNRPESVLVVATQRIGDVLLATPLIRSLRQAWPQAALDALVFEGTEGVIAANPDLRRVLSVPRRPRVLEHALFIARLLRRYDMALSVLAGDRPTLYAFFAGRWRAGMLVPGRKEAWKRRLLNRWVPFDDVNTHTVAMNLALADLVGVPRSGEVVISWSAEDEQRVSQVLGDGAGKRLAVLHVFPKYHYKMWRPEAWREVGSWLVDHGFHLALTGSADAAELAYVDSIARAMPAGTINAAGKLSLGASACLVHHAQVFVGPDTAMTHVAAALGVPTIAIYGPTNPIKWGPWPRNQAPDINPWRRCGTQQVGNVFLVQGSGACVPCHLEGCERHVLSYSDCLQTLAARTVIKAVEAALGDGFRADRGR